MKYMGSKRLISKHLIPLFSKNNYYIEPFVGGANVIDKITFGLKIASDIDEDLICLYQAVSEGWLPPKNFTEEDYRSIRQQPTSPLKGYAAFALSYGGKKWGGWRRDKENKRDYVDEAYRNSIKQFPNLRDIKFIHTDFVNLELPNERSTIYCDPPYKNTTSYTSKFNHDLFWNWVREISNNHDVYVSEYIAPSDFKCLWSKPTNTGLGNKTAVEKLFVYDELTKDY